MPVHRVVKLSPAVLDDRALLAIGRLVRACADIEDHITLFICCLASISESQAVALLGRTPVSAKLSIAQYFAKMRSDGATATYAKVFNSNFSKVLTCRNAVAHGVLMGANEDGAFGFLTAKTVDPMAGAAVQLVNFYTVEMLEAFAKVAEDALPLMEQELQTTALRDTRRQQPLAAHPAGQRQQKKSKAFT